MPEIDLRIRTEQAVAALRDLDAVIDRVRNTGNLASTALDGLTDSVRRLGAEVESVKALDTALTQVQATLGRVRAEAAGTSAALASMDASRLNSAVAAARSLDVALSGSSTAMQRLHSEASGASGAMGGMRIGDEAQSSIETLIRDLERANREATQLADTMRRLGTGGGTGPGAGFGLPGLPGAAGGPQGAMAAILLALQSQQGTQGGPSGVGAAVALAALNRPPGGGASFPPPWVASPPPPPPMVPPVDTAAMNAATESVERTQAAVEATTNSVQQMNAALSATPAETQSVATQMHGVDQAAKAAAQSLETLAVSRRAFLQGVAGIAGALVAGGQGSPEAAVEGIGEALTAAAPPAVNLASLLEKIQSIAGNMQEYGELSPRVFSDAAIQRWEQLTEEGRNAHTAGAPETRAQQIMGPAFGADSHGENFADRALSHLQTSSLEGQQQTLQRLIENTQDWRDNLIAIRDVLGDVGPESAQVFESLIGEVTQLNAALTQLPLERIREVLTSAPDISSALSAPGSSYGSADHLLHRTREYERLAEPDSWYYSRDSGSYGLQEPRQAEQMQSAMRDMLSSGPRPSEMMTSASNPEEWTAAVQRMRELADGIERLRGIIGDGEFFRGMPASLRQVAVDAETAANVDWAGLAEGVRDYTAGLSQQQLASNSIARRNQLGGSPQQIEPARRPDAIQQIDSGLQQISAQIDRASSASDTLVRVMNAIGGAPVDRVLQLRDAYAALNEVMSAAERLPVSAGRLEAVSGDTDDQRKVERLASLNGALRATEDEAARAKQALSSVGTDAPSFEPVEASLTRVRETLAALANDRASLSTAGISEAVGSIRQAITDLVGQVEEAQTSLTELGGPVPGLEDTTQQVERLAEATRLAAAGPTGPAASSITPADVDTAGLSVGITNAREAAAGLRTDLGSIDMVQGAIEAVNAQMRDLANFAREASIGVTSAAEHLDELGNVDIQSTARASIASIKDEVEDLHVALGEMHDRLRDGESDDGGFERLAATATALEQKIAGVKTQFDALIATAGSGQDSLFLTHALGELDSLEARMRNFHGVAEEAGHSLTAFDEGASALNRVFNQAGDLGRALNSLSTAQQAFQGGSMGATEFAAQVTTAHSSVQSLETAVADFQAEAEHIWDFDTRDAEAALDRLEQHLREIHSQATGGRGFSEGRELVEANSAPPNVVPTAAADSTEALAAAFERAGTGARDVVIDFDQILASADAASTGATGMADALDRAASATPPHLQISGIEELDAQLTEVSDALRELEEEAGHLEDSLDGAERMSDAMRALGHETDEAREALSNVNTIFDEAMADGANLEDAKRRFNEVEAAVESVVLRVDELDGDLQSGQADAGSFGTLETEAGDASTAVESLKDRFEELRAAAEGSPLEGVYDKLIGELGTLERRMDDVAGMASEDAEEFEKFESAKNEIAEVATEAAGLGRYLDSATAAIEHFVSTGEGSREMVQAMEHLDRAIEDTGLAVDGLSDEARDAFDTRLIDRYSEAAENLGEQLRHVAGQVQELATPTIAAPSRISDRAAAAEADSAPANQAPTAVVDSADALADALDRAHGSAEPVVIDFAQITAHAESATTAAEQLNTALTATDVVPAGAEAVAQLDGDLTSAASAADHMEGAVDQATSATQQLATEARAAGEAVEQIPPGDEHFNEVLDEWNQRVASLHEQLDHAKNSADDLGSSGGGGGPGGVDGGGGGGGGGGGFGRAASGVVDSIGSILSVSRLATGVIAGFATSFVVDKIRDFTRHIIESTAAVGELHDKAAKLSLTAEALQELGFAFQQSGVEVAQFETGFARFSNKLGQALEGNDKAAKSFSDLGVAIRENGMPRDAESVFLATADAIAGMSNETKQLAEVSEFFGVRNLGMINGLRGGARALEDLRKIARESGMVIREDLVNRADELDDKFKATTGVIKTQFQVALLDLMPIVNDLASVFAELTRATTAWIDTFRDVETAPIAELERRIKAARVQHEQTPGVKPSSAWWASEAQQTLAAGEAARVEVRDRWGAMRNQPKPTARTNPEEGDPGSGDTSSADRAAQAILDLTRANELLRASIAHVTEAEMARIRATHALQDVIKEFGSGSKQAALAQEQFKLTIDEVGDAEHEAAMEIARSNDIAKLKIEGATEATIGAVEATNEYDKVVKQYGKDSEVARAADDRRRLTLEALTKAQEELNNEMAAEKSEGPLQRMGDLLNKTTPPGERAEDAGAKFDEDVVSARHIMGDKEFDAQFSPERLKEMRDAAIEAAGGFDELNQSIEQATGRALQSFSDSFSQSMTDVIMGTKSMGDGFKDFAAQAIASIVSIIAQLIVMKSVEAGVNAIGGAMGYAGIGTALLGARAAGGPVEKGKPYMVGEAGPELWTPDSAGTITPNYGLDMGGAGGGGQQVSVTVINNGPPLREEKREEKRSGRRFDLSITMGRAGAEDVQRGGEMFRSLRDTTGLEKKTRSS